MTTAAGLPASTLISNAWEWSDSAPWSKRTVSVAVTYSPMGDDNHVPFDQLADSDEKIFYGEWQRLNIPEKYDTDTYISPVNVRISFGGCRVRNDNDSRMFSPKFSIDLNSGENDSIIFNDVYHTSPIVNIPIQNPDTDYYWFRVRFLIPSTDDSYYIISNSTLTLTYDIYYRDSSGGNLPDGWIENTTAPTATLPDDLPTVTTAVNPDDTAEQISGLMKFPSGLLDGMHYLRDTIAQILGLRYVSFIVVLGLICALVAWFLH